MKLYEGASEATDVFISAYVEGSSYNKAIALYNGTSHSVNIADYALGGSYSAWSDILNVTTNDKEPTSVLQMNEGTLQYVITEGAIALRNIPVGSQVSLYDMQGFRCYESLVQNSDIAIEGARSGIYILEIIDNGSVYHIKIKL